MPLQQGDTIEIVFDNIQIFNTNENYLKCIAPIYNLEYFQMTDMQINTPTISQHHKWEYSEGNLCEGLIFDNGHRDGLNATGNWGYEPCQDEGGCTDLKLNFVVTHLPPKTQAVSCPLEGLEISYDGDLETWNSLPTCENKIVYYANENLGAPVIQGDSLSSINNCSKINEITIYPNPTSNFVFLKDFMEIDLEYKIYNSIGLKIQNGKTEQGRINVSKLSANLYILVLKIEENYFHYKILKT